MTDHEASHVLDGLLYHESSLVIGEHYTDTGGFSDHLFAVCHFYGLRYVPRIRDLKEKRLYTIPGGHGARQPEAAGSWKHQYQDNPCPLGGHFARRGLDPDRHGYGIHALRELGKVKRILFTLDWMQDPELRRRSHVGLNKGEQQNALRRTVFFNRLGEIPDRSYENQRYRTSGLNLVVGAIVLSNTVYLQRDLLLVQPGRDAEAPRPGASLAARLGAHQSHCLIRSALRANLHRAAPLAAENETSNGSRSAIAG